MQNCLALEMELTTVTGKCCKLNLHKWKEKIDCMMRYLVVTGFCCITRGYMYFTLQNLRYVSPLDC